SLLRSLADPTGEPRFTMLETIREYALERLDEAGEQDQVRTAHARHFERLAEEISTGMLSTDRSELLRRFDIERENIRAAVESALAGPDGELALRFAASVARVAQGSRYVPSARTWVERALALAPAADPELRSVALARAGVIADSTGDREEA